MKMPRKYIFQMILSFMVVISAGCIKTEHNLYFKKDGSITYKLKYSISEQAVIQFRAMENLKNQLAESRGEPKPGIEMDPLLHLFLDPNEAALRTAFKEYEAMGVVLKELEVRTVSARRHINLKVEIKNPAKIAESQFFKDNGFNLTKDSDGNYVFYREPHINRPGEIAKVPSEKELRQLIPVVGGFNTTVRISVPGKIISTTAFNNTLNNASWTFDFDREPGAIQALQHQAFRVVFKAPNTNFPEMHYRGSTITK
jgi:hypothetical protein